MATGTEAASALLAARDALIKQQSHKSKLRRTNSMVISLPDLAFAYHVAFLAIYAKVWVWHWTPAAAGLPGAQGFGFFFRYLTFCSFTLQLVQLMFCVAARIPKSEKTRLQLTHWADDLSCALFGLAHAVTLLYYGIHSATKGDVVEGGVVERPPWLGFAVHVMNTLFAWGDLLLAEPRTFSKRASRLCTTITVAYCLWILLIRHITGVFPYPFLNKIPFPTGFVAMMVGGVVIFRCAFEGGRGVSWVARHWKQ